MLKNKNYLNRIVISLLAFTYFTFGQSDFTFKNISVKDGLAESTVKVIFEDHNGFIYFGTENGLDVYDGYEFTNYQMNSFDEASLLGNKISSIHEDSNHMIWVGSELGVSLFDPSKREFSRPIDTGDEELVDSEIITDDSKGNIWIKLKDNGLVYQYNTASDELKDMNHSFSDDEMVTVLHRAPSGTILLGTSFGLYYYDNDKKEVNKVGNKDEFDGLFVNALVNGNENDIWVGTSDGLFKLNNGINGDVDVFRQGKGETSLVSNYVKDLDWDEKRNELWIATQNGLSRYNPSEAKFFNIQMTPYADSIIENDISEILIAVRSGRLWYTTENHTGFNCLSVEVDPYSDGPPPASHFEHDPIDKGSIADNVITDFIEDRAGHVWIGTGQNGISFYSYVKPKFVHHKYDQENEWGLKNEKIYSISTQSDGMMWVASGFGLEKISYDGIREQEYEKSILNVNYIIDLEIINDVMLWVATDQGILKIDTWNDYDAENILRFSDSDSLPPSRRISDNLVHDILSIEDKIWVATGSGMVIIDTTTNSVTDFNSDLIARVISQDSKGNIWLGTEMDGLFKIPSDLLDDIQKGKDFELEGHIFDKSYRSGISSSQITCVTEDRNGVIWVGTNGGLNKYISEDDNFEHYFVQDGLPSNYITGVVVDDSNGLWISSKKGISFFDQTDKTFTNYSLTDGIGNIDFHRHSYDQSADGYIFFGGPMGITKVKPEEVQFNEYQPPCVITRLKKTYFDDSISEIYSFDNADISGSEDNAVTMLIDHKVKSFTVDFVALNYHQTVKNQYRYKLEPFDRDWVESGGLRFASYNNLGRNTYNFMVQGSNDDGVWSEPAKLNIKFIPHPLLSIWAFTIYAVISLIGVFLFIRHRMDKQKSQLEEERRIQEMEQARDFQMSLIPQSPPEHPDYDIALHMKTSTEVGGDYYDFFPQEDGSMYVVCGDATGHGLNAGMMVSITKAGLYGSNFDTPASTTTRLNRTIKAIDLGTTRMSLNMAKFHNGSFDFTSAGMPPAYLYKHSEKEVDEILVPGLPLGSMKKADFDLHSFNLESNDALVLISDGLPECVNHEGEMLDYEPVKECITANGNKSAQGIIDSLIDLGDEWMSGLMNDDDITLVVIKKK